MQTNKIAILMATYNGEKYLREQIDSLFAQTCQDWHLYVHDDGSSDGTVAILKEYEKKYPTRITLMDYPSQGGACKNFLSMLERVDAPYYMFCDQDDVWHSEKIEESLFLMKKEELLHLRAPIVVHTDLRVVNEEGKVEAQSFWEKAGMHPNMFKKPEQRIANIVTGCTMLFNNDARKKAMEKIPQGNPMHDEWVTVRTCLEGGIVAPLYKQLIDYRQHYDNTLGAEACYNRKTLKYYFTKKKKIFNENKENFIMLRSAGYGSLFTYLKNKIRNIIVYHLNY